MKTNVALQRGGRRFLQTAGDRPDNPLAAGDLAAVQVVARMVQDAGFEPVVVGGLSRAEDLDACTPVFGKRMTAAEARRTLGIGS